MPHHRLLQLYACMLAAVKVQPHLFIPGLMQPYQKKYVSNPKDRGQFSAVAFVHEVGGVYLYPLTGTKGCDATIQPDNGQYKTKAGKTASAMTMDEYTKAVDAALLHYKEKGVLEGSWEKLTLVHDNARTHPRGDGHGKLLLPSGSTINVRMPSARSPDLMPCDYYLFGMAKRKVAPKTHVESNWQKRAQTFYWTLLDAPTKAAIASFPKRLVACIQAKGGHFERL